jgi:ribosome assembly protein YihI (activator of Der GTPase)
MEVNLVEKLKNRQLAKLLTHLEQTGQLTIELEKTLKRSFRYAFEDVETLIQRLGLDKEDKNDNKN